MKRNKTIRIVTFLAIALFALGILSTNVQPARAYTFTRSSYVAMVPDNHSSNGGYLYTGSTWPDSSTEPGFTFTNVDEDDIADGSIADPLVAGGYDTVMLLTSDFNFATYWADADFQSRIISFVNGGGKLIIYTSESPTAWANNFASFIVPFTVDTPGQTGSSGGTVVNVADDTLSSSNSAVDTYPSGLGSYINLALLTASTDAVGDCNVMTSTDPNWYIDMTAINVRSVGGPAHTYAFYGNGLIIFNGFDIDYGSTSTSPNNVNGAGAIQMVWWRELCGQDLGQGQSVSGLTVLPATAQNPVDTTHTVTALVKDSINDPVPGVLVTFNILTGPNAGVTGTATTDANGEATFSWSSSVAGIDTVQASIPGATGAAPITTTATKTWYVSPTNVIPEVPLGTAAITATMLIGLAAFYAKRRTKTPKL
jgi:hypothetical protein